MALLSCVAALCALLAFTSAQCSSNTVAIDHPNLRTMATNNTWFLVPVPKPAVQQALDQAFPLGNLSLLDLPTDDSTLFPSGFPPDMHPILTTIGLNADIRMSALQIRGGLKNAAVLAPYVAQHGDPTPLAASLAGYIAGEDGPLPNGLVPAVASPLLFAGTPLRLGEFAPRSAAYGANDDEGERFAQAKWALVPNDVSGPGVYAEAVDHLFHARETAQRFTAKLFKTVINQPLVLPSGKCQRNQYYFTSGATGFLAGNVTLGPAASGVGVTEGVLMQASPEKNGLYEDVEGFTGCAQVVGFNPESCAEAGKDLDPAALE